MNDTNLEYYVEQFIGLYDRNSKEFRDELHQLISMAKMYGATKEKYRILDMVRNKHMLIAVDTFQQNNVQIMKVVADTLVKELERKL